LEGLYFRSDPETSHSDLQCPDLYFYQVSVHLEASFIRAEIIGFDSFRRAQLNWMIQHLEEFSLVFRFEISGGDSTHPDLQFDIFSVAFGGL
jgi:hypothetical protein